MAERAADYWVGDHGFANGGNVLYPCSASRHDESEPAVSSQPSTDVPERLGPEA